MANGEVGGVDFLTHPGTTNDEEFAFNLQKEEIKLAAESSKRKQEQEMRVKQREREREREREIRAVQQQHHLNTKPRTEEMTKQDEQVARQLQEEFDKELALSIDHHQTLNDNSRDLNRNFRNNIHRNANNNRNSNNTHVIRPIRDLADFSATSSDDTTREDTVTEAYPVLFHRLGDSGISIANSSRPDLPINLQTSRGQNLNSILERFTEEIHGRNQANSNRNNNRSRASNDHPFNNSNLSGFRSRNSINRLLMQSDNFDANDYDTLLRLDDFHSQKKTLTSQEFKSLPQFEYQRSSGNQDAQCSICMDDFENKVKITALTCSHKFHTKCIEEWLSKQSRVCPLCKKDAVNGK